MVHDLRTILDGWDYEPGKISVRKIIGQDGREKIQTRVDLGVLQFEVLGRPDGQRPEGHDTMLDCCEARLTAHVERHGSDEGFALTPEECAELRHEAHLHYQRFLSLFVLEEFDAVERDTARNLRLFDLCRAHGSTEADRTALEAQRAYVEMMNVRARTYRSVQRQDFEGALRHVEQGVARLTEHFRQAEAEPDEAPEMQVLVALRQEVIDRMPADAGPRLQVELQAALEREDYERAAELRDKLSATGRTTRRR